MEDIVKNEFLFYSKLAKPLILNLPKSKDRILAAAWIKKFMDESVGDENLRTTYLKLLLFCLQRRKLTGIFSDDPIEYNVLEELPHDYDLNELAKNLLDQEKEERKERIRLEMMGDMAVFPAYTTDCSPDLTEYVAAQDIPNFGVHAFYAISKQPINKWQRAEKAILPKGVKSAIDTSITTTAAQLDSSCVCVPKGAASAPEVEEAPADADAPDCKKMKKDKEPERKKRRSKKMGHSPPTHPIGEVRSQEEERVTPTWGTNLLEVKELTDVGKIDEPSEAQIQLEEEVSKLLEEAEEEEDDEEEGPQEDTASKAAEMLRIVDEWKQEKMDKSKAKKGPERLLKLGDRSGVKVPKSTKAPPKIAVRGMKDGKGKGKGKYGPKPDNLPEEYADWTEKDLEEAGLTWADLMPVDEDIDAELKRIEQEEMAGLGDEDLDEPQMPDAYDGLDYDALIREAEMDLERHKTTYDVGVEEDEPVVDLFDEEIEELEDEQNLSRAAEEVQTASPALTRGIPVTTPIRSPTPRRPKSPEKIFAQEDDVLLQPRQSPLRAPKQDPAKKKKSGIPMRSRIPGPRTVTVKDLNISQVYESARVAADKSYAKHKKELEEEEFERLEQQFTAEEGECPPCTSSSVRQPSPPPPGSPGAAQRVLQRAQQQEQALRTPPPAQDPAYTQFASYFEDAEGDLEEEEEPCIPCSPPPLDRSPRVYSPTTGAPLPIPEFPYEREDVGSPDRYDPAELKFLREFEGQPGDVQGEEPCIPCGSPPPMTEEEEFELLEGMYASPPQRPPPQEVYSPTTGAPLPIPEYDYGPEDVGVPDRFGAPSPPPPEPSPPRPQMITDQELQLQRAAAMTRAWEQEVRLRQGSPQAAQIINEAEVTLEGDLGRRLRIGQDKMIEESPPPGVKTPPKKIQLPPRPLFSPTTGAPLPVPDYDIAPEQLGEVWEDGEEIPEFTLTRQADYLYMPTMEEREERSRQARTDIFERMGEPYMAAVDTAPRRPQYFPPGTDVGSDSPPIPIEDIRRHEVPDQFFDPKYRGMKNQSNICVGAKRREKFLRRKNWPVRQVSPIADAPYQEYLHDKLEEFEYKGPVPQAQGLSPWRDEDVYYTPSEGDSTLEDLDYPLLSPPRIRTPAPGQRPEERPVGYKSPFIPGVASPITPPQQRPELRPEGFKSPFIPGVSSPITPDIRGQYPFRRRPEYRTPPSPDSPLPLEAYFDPFEYEEIGLSDAELVDADLPFESPEPYTPQDDRRMPSPGSGRSTPSRRRRGPIDLDEEGSPRRPAQRQMMARKLFAGDQTCDPCGSETPPRPTSPERLPPSRLPSRGKIPSRIPSRGPIPSRSQIPSRRQIDSQMPQPGPQTSVSRAVTPPPQRPSPAPCPGSQETPVGRRLPEPPGRRVPQRQLGMGTPTGFADRPSRRLFEGDDVGAEPPGAPCGPTEPVGIPPPRRRSPKHVTPPQQPPPPVTSPWSTPEGMPGPSRRRTGETPEGYNSDFDRTPPPKPPTTPKFPPPKRFKKRGRRPPSPPPPPSPRTPTDQRPMPSPYVPSRGPCRGAAQTPTRPGAAAQILSRRVFEGRGDLPREPPEEPPIEYSPIGPFVPDEGWVSPPLPPPEHYEGPMYFPPEAIDQASPGRRQYPTVEEIAEHQVVQDKLLRKHSRTGQMGMGPGPYVYRSSKQPILGKMMGTPNYRQIPFTTPEYECSSAYRADLFGRKDLEWDELMKYDQQPPGLQPRSGFGGRITEHFESPRRRPRSPRIERAQPCDPCGGEEDDIQIIEDEEGDLSFPSPYGDALEEALEANLRVPPEHYPPPAAERRTPPPPMERPHFEERFANQAHLQRADAFLEAARTGTLTQHIGQRHFEDIAEQADMLFDTAGGLFDQTPPDQIGPNYYPDILQATSRLGRAMEQYDLPESPIPSPFLSSPGTPPGFPPQWSPASVPSGSPRTPPPRQVAPPPSRGPCGPGPCGAGAGVATRPSKRRVPPKPLRETKSSQLRKQQQAKKDEEKLSPTSKMMKKRREKAAKAAEDKKKLAAAKRQAEEEAKRAESMARVAEGLPGGKMRPRDYRAAGGTGGAPLISAEKRIPQEQEDHESAAARRQLFGGPCRPGSAATGEIPRRLTGKKTKGKKGPGPPTGVYRRRDSDDDLAVPLSEQGPEFMQELEQHQIVFPRRQLGVVVGGGKFKRIPRKSGQAINQMHEIMEEARSPCAPCGEEAEDDYEAALREMGITPQQAAATFDEGFLDELEEQAESPRSPDAIQQLETQLRDMDDYDRQQQEFWREMASDLTDEELRELGVTRESLRKPAPAPSGTCGSAKPGRSRSPQKPQLTQQQQQILSQLQELEERADQLGAEPQRSPVLNEFDLIEQAVIQREQEEQEYFERMLQMEREGQIQSPVRSPVRSPPQRVMTEEEEQMEFEELERQMAMEAQQEGQVCPGSRSPVEMPGLDEAAFQQENMMRKRLLEQQLQTQGPRIRGRPFPAAGINYSPPRPQGIFGPPPYQQEPGRLPIPSPPRQVTPPRRRTPPLRTPPQMPSPRIPSPPSPPPSPPGILEETPPYLGDMEDEDRFSTPPCRPPSPPQWIATPPPPRVQSPPPFITTPPSPPLLAGELREQIASMARPEFDPVRRRDLLPRDERRAFRAPGVSMYNVQEEEPLIPCLAGNESFMGYPIVPGEKPPIKRRRRYKDLEAKRLFGKSEVSKMCRRLEKKYNLPELPPELQSPEDFILDERLPGDLPRPIAPRWLEVSPIQRPTFEPIPLAHWEGVGYRQPGLRPASPCRPQMPDITEIYRGGEEPVHPDLVDLVGYEPPLEIPEGIDDLMGMEVGDEAYYSPEQYPEIEEMELDREAALAYEPPWVMKNIWLASPKEMGLMTPPSIGKGPCGTYTPTATPPLQILESPDLQGFDDDFVAPAREVPDPVLQEFLITTPPLEKETSLQELKYYTYHAKGREGIRPKPMHFGGYGETPRRPIPRWYGRGGARNVIQEVDEPFSPPSPPTPGTPPPQLPAPCSPCTQDLIEFEQMEQEIQEEEARRSRRSKRRKKRDQIEAQHKQMLLGELTEQAERMEMERRMAPRRMPAPPRAPSPQRPPTPRIPTPPPLPAFGYSPEAQAEEAPGSPYGPPAIDNRALELYMLEEMGFDASAIPPLITPPGTPEYFEQDAYDVFEGFESPPPLSPVPEGPCMPCTPPTPPSPPTPPGSPVPPPKPQWQKTVEDLERRKREEQESEERRQQFYQRNLEEIGQMFGPSPGPPSPGPDADFYANVYAHQIPEGFRQGQRPRVAVRDQIGSRELTMRIPRHTPATGLAGTVITEPRVRITVPEQQRRRRPPSRPRTAPTAAPSPQLEQSSSAQRIAEARKYYQQMGRQRTMGTSIGGQIARPAQAPRQMQLNLQGVEEFLQQPDQQAASCSESGVCTSGAKPRITPEEAQRRAKERLRAKRVQQQATPAGRAPAAAPPQPKPFTGFVPTQLRQQIPRPEPQPEPPQSVEDFVRRGPRPGAGPSASRMSSRGQLLTSRQGGGCGGGQSCGRGRQGPEASAAGGARSRSATPTQQQPNEEGPRRVVKKTSSVKRIVTKQNK